MTKEKIAPMTVEYPVPNKRLQRARLQKGWKQERLAAELGVAFETVSRWERGEIIPSPLFREQLCRVFDASLEELGLSWDPQEAHSTLPPPSLVLISASAEADHAFVLQLMADYQAQGIAAWSPRAVKHLDGAQKRNVLRKAIRSAELVVVIASPSTRSSRDVRAALELTALYRRPICAAWIAGEQWQSCFPQGGIELVTIIDARMKPQETVFKDIMGLYEQAQRLSRETAAEGKMVLPPPAQSHDESAHVPRNPYKGLKAFHVDDQRDFFGRDQVIGELIALLATALRAEHRQEPARLLAVLGPSGSGKSSVVMAGVLPRLQSGGIAGSEHWVYLDPIVPGIHPLESLAQLLAEHLPERHITAIREELEDDSARGLHLLASSLARPAQTKVMLVVDQCEELFTLTTEDTERQAFIDLLVSAATEPQGPVIVILTLRADFSDRLLLSPDLGHLIQKHPYIVLPMDIHDLRAVIEEPARLPEVQVTLERTLVGDLLFEANGQPGALPLLEFTLDQLFQQRDGHRLSLAAYQQLGGLKGALVRQAESTYAALPSGEHRKLARALFLRLIDPGMTEQDTTRRRAALSDLSLPDKKQTTIIRQVVDAFVAGRLLTTNEIGGITTVEVSHEALIREWPRLANWLHEGREDIRLQRTLSEDAAGWEQHGKPKDRLYRGSQLKEVQTWGRRNTMSRKEWEFLQASAGQRRWYVVGVTAILLMLVSMTGLSAWLLHTSKPGLTIVYNLPTTITNLHDSGPGSLRQVIDSVPTGSVITFASGLRGGTIMLTSSDLVIAKDLTIRGPGADNLTISTPSPGGYGYIIVVDSGVSVTISGLAFKNSVIKNRSSVYGNNTSSFINNYGTLTLVNCIVSGNYAGFFPGGGGVSNNGGTLTITNSTISGNTSASFGGGIYSESGALIITNSTVSGNTTYGPGGGIFSGDGALTITNSTVSGNTANGDGGGIHIEIGGYYPLTITNSTVSDNTADGDGGGIANLSSSKLTLINNTISNNTTSTSGGGIWNSGSEADMTFCTVYGNRAKEIGGGFFNEDGKDPSGTIVSGHLLMTNSLVAHNLAPKGPDGAGTLITGGYNLIQKVSGVTFANPLKQHFTDVSVDSSEDVGINPTLSGGPSQVHALLPGSPAIDRIPVNACHPNDITTDQRGVKRPDENEQYCDIGAYEY